MAVGADLALPQVEGHRSVSMRFANWHTDRVLTAAESDPGVTEGFFRVMNLIDPPSRLLHPSLILVDRDVEDRAFDGGAGAVEMPPFTGVHGQPTDAHGGA